MKLSSRVAAAAPGCVCAYAERSTWIPACPVVAMLLSTPRTLIDLECSYEVRSRSPLRGEVWWWLLAGAHLQLASAHVVVVAVTLIFDFKSFWRHRAPTLSKAARFLSHLRQNSEAVSLGPHTCATTPHPGHRSVMWAHTYVFGAVVLSAGLQRSKWGSSQLPAPLHYQFLNLQHSHVLKKDLVL